MSLARLVDRLARFRGYPFNRARFQRESYAAPIIGWSTCDDPRGAEAL